MDTALQSLFQAMDHASLIWQQAIYRLGWSHAAVASAYGAAAWLCFLNMQIEEEALGSCALWWIAAVLMCLLGVNTVLQADVLVTQTFRALSRLQGWYGQRRALQYLVIGLITMAVLTTFNSRTRLSQKLNSCSGVKAGAVSAGLLALMLLFVVRLVSAHGTDAVLSMRLFGLSIGRWFEMACITSVMWGALRSLRRPWANPQPQRKDIDRHV